MEYKIINSEYLDSVSGGDPLIIKDLVDIFRDQVAETIETMRDLNNKGDFPQLALLAHKIKSSVSIMGMNDLAIMLKTFELKARESEDPGSYNSYIQRLESDCASAIIELDNLIANRLKQP
ncbi:MAG TPA: Hpt domain-containing protein [Bacteroidales bacterium]|nr:Hpt domain-containing protein [Bacteroidales bacterium]